MHALLLIATTLLAVADPPRIAADTPHLTLAVEMTTNAAGVPVVHERFSTLDAWHHSVLCASGFFDIRYVLRDAKGAIVPADSQPWKRGSDYVAGPVVRVAQGSQLCKHSVVPIVNREVLLTDYYPNLKRGSYTLYLILAPRNTSYRAKLPPIHVTW